VAGGGFDFTWIWSHTSTDPICELAGEETKAGRKKGKGGSPNFQDRRALA
jgi:hypothetical protein